MWGKIIIVVLLLAIVFNLFRGLFFLVKDKDRDKKSVVNSLSWRIGLSFLLFLLLFVLNYFGVVEFHSLPSVKPE
ncbi:MAG: twin transmembrane helix small protein [Gammaproteobacteria bacterium]|nr:twin transmembrane helix small protein [Gammaproteobacteria bacterium]